MPTIESEGEIDPVDKDEGNVKKRPQVLRVDIPKYPSQLLLPSKTMMK